MQENGLWLDYLDNSYNQRRRSQSREAIEQESTKDINQTRVAINKSTLVKTPNYLRPAAGQHSPSRLATIPESQKITTTKRASQPMSFMRPQSTIKSTSTLVSVNNHSFRPAFESEQYKRKAQEGLKRRMSYNPSASAVKKSRNSGYSQTHCEPCASTSLRSNSQLLNRSVKEVTQVREPATRTIVTFDRPKFQSQAANNASSNFNLSA